MGVGVTLVGDGVGVNAVLQSITTNLSQAFVATMRKPTDGAVLN